MTKGLESPVKGPWFTSALRGGVIYASGDSIAALITGLWSIHRMIGIFTIGATLYAFEIQLYFKWIDRRVQNMQGPKKVWAKTAMALLYFNPIWIARHLLIIHIVSGNFEMISWALLLTGLKSFVFNIPVSIAANYWIQNKIVISNRFYASAIFSGIMAIYYSMSSVWF